jgi:hypothetical protein
LTAFKSVANFESVELDQIFDMLYPKVLSKKFTVSEILTGKEKEFNAYLDKKGKSSSNMFINNQAFILLIIPFMLFVLALVVIRWVSIKKRDMIDKKIKDIKKELIFSGIIYSIILQYMVNLTAFKIVIDMENAGEPVPQNDLITAVVLGIGLFLFPILMALFIK